jgi:hypothetical protein
MFEWEDQPWFPNLLRQMQTDFIGWLVEVMHVYQNLGSHVNSEQSFSGDTVFIDLCSGNGGPVKDLISGIQKRQTTSKNSSGNHIRAILTDKFPPISFSNTNQIKYHPTSIDALEVPDTLIGIRTMFNAFHHFSEDQKRKLIHVHGEKGFLVAEIITPDLLSFVKILFTTIAGQILLAPFVRPFSWLRLLFTYLLPVNLFTVTWDGLVSVLKSEKFDNMKQRAEQFAPSECLVSSGRCGKWYAPVNWFYIRPKQSHESY